MRSLMLETKWDILRKKIYADYNYCCGVCEINNTTLHCHEIWEYDDLNHIQKLKGFIALCKFCHWVKHIGLAGMRASEDELDFEQIVAHFMKVNSCDRQTFEAHRNQAFRIWEERSKHQWQIQLGEFAL
ncbi:TPA: HNH endonuclease [Patescibacteria group bacterium]|nr:HNH endonuclease [Patescibacteria group bacterium]